ncbi:TPA: hypothetical protein DCQ44_03360, partial [Candidatus Taylorbacteria bacterium]|nr:hypothetical protein [Candidatus Taylorbacteria bacterium]
MIDDLQPINNGSQPAPVPSPVTPAPIQTTVATPSFVSTPPVVPIPQATVPQVSPLRQSGVVQAMPIVSNYVVPRKNGLKYVALIILLFLALGGGYVFAAKYNFVPNILPRLLPFAQSAYTPQTFFSSILAKSAGITSSAYKATFSLDVGNRDIDAKPFQVVVTNEAAIREQYQNDSQRAQDISSILSLFPRISTYDNKLKKYIVVPVIYPATLQKAVANVVKNNQYYRNTSITDPSTEKEYVYKSTEGGNNFNLTLTFETDDAIKAIRRSNPVATTTMINGKTVTFTKDSQTYFYLPTEPPKPILVQLGEMMRSLPADVKVSFDAGAQADFTNISTMANWLAQFNAEGSFGDLSYKVNAEARKKDSNYYVRINNIPCLLYTSDAADD